MYAGIVEYIFIGHGQQAIQDAQAVIEAEKTDVTNLFKQRFFLPFWETYAIEIGWMILQGISK